MARVQAAPESPAGWEAVPAVAISTVPLWWRDNADVDLKVQAVHDGRLLALRLNWKDDTGLARDWLARLGNPYTATAVDQDGRVAIDWGVYGAPETFLLDGAGIVLYKHIAPLTPDVWEQEFLPRIRQARGAVN